MKDSDTLGARALLFALDTGSGLWSAQESLDELAQLAKTAGIVPIGRATQKRETPHPASYMGPGKLEEVAEQIEAAGAEMLLVDGELAPAQQRILEDRLGVEVVDRTALILDIFARHARTREGQLQVELAQYEYLMPRLAGMWSHLERQVGGRRGGVGLRGPGETQLELDRRLVRRRIAVLREELERVRAHRLRYRERRRRNQIPVVALTGYTNAGKSSLLNLLSDAGVPVADRLFATLDPTTRRVRLPGGTTVLFSDTVGFVNKLPHQLVAAFRATLEEIAEADIVLLLVDSAHPRAEQQHALSRKVLQELGVAGERILTVWNKIDLLAAGADPPNSGPHISALTGAGVDGLLRCVEAQLRADMVRVEVSVPYSEARLAHTIRSEGIVLAERAEEEALVFSAYLPRRLARRLLGAGATGAL